MAGPNDAINFQVVIPVIAAVVGLFGGWFAKIRELRYQDRKSEAATWTIQQQTHWGPLLKSARELKERLEDLTTIYNDDQKKGEAASLSADFRELYLMRREEVQNFQNCDPDAARKNKDDVQTIRSRMCHELTFAESSVYITATYLGHSEHVWRDLNERALQVPEDARKEMLGLINGVRQSLQGPGAGIFREQQRYIGEAVLISDRHVISNLDFRNRILEMPGWETFKNLLRFYADLAPKIPWEVQAAIKALGKVEEGIEILCGSKGARSYDAATWSGALFAQRGLALGSWRGLSWWNGFSRHT